MWKRLATHLLCLAVLAGLGALFDDGWYYPHLGTYQLAVRLEPEDGRQVVRVWPAPMVLPRDQAERAQADLRAGGGLPSASQLLGPVERFDEGWFYVPCDCLEVKSGFGRDLEYHEIHQTLAMRVEFADGATEWVVVRIPEGRGERSVTVPVP
jgi:hypothetical protein